MALEFRCQACGQLMSVGDEFAGRQAQCPGCHNFILVPTTSQPIERLVSWTRPVTDPDVPTTDQSTSDTAENPYSAPQVTDSVVPTAMIFDPADVMRISWTIFKNRLKDIAIGTLIFAVLHYTLTYPIMPLLEKSGIVFQTEAVTQADLLRVTGQLILLYSLTSLITAWLAPGYIEYMLKICRGEKVAIRELFQGYRHYIRYLLVSMVTFLLILIGLNLLIFPGIYLALVFMPVSYIVVDKKVGVLTTLQASIVITRYKLLNIFMLIISGLVVAILTLLTVIGPTFVGVLMTVMYLRMSGQPVSDGIIRDEPISNL